MLQYSLNFFRWSNWAPFLFFKGGEDYSKTGKNSLKWGYGGDIPVTTSLLHYIWHIYYASTASSYKFYQKFVF